MITIVAMPPIRNHGPNPSLMNVWMSLAQVAAPTAAAATIVSADSQILEQCCSWLNLARQIVELNMSEAIVAPLNGELAP